MPKFTASRLSDGNKIFPDEIIIDDTTVTIRSPKLFGGSATSFPLGQITVSVNSPFIGYSDINLYANGTSMSVHGFTSGDASRIKRLISQGISTPKQESYNKTNKKDSDEFRNILSSIINENKERKRENEITINSNIEILRDEIITKLVLLKLLRIQDEKDPECITCEIDIQIDKDELQKMLKLKYPDVWESEYDDIINVCEEESELKFDESLKNVISTICDQIVNLLLEDEDNPYVFLPMGKVKMILEKRNHTSWQNEYDSIIQSCYNRANLSKKYQNELDKKQKVTFIKKFIDSAIASKEEELKMLEISLKKIDFEIDNIEFIKQIYREIIVFDDFISKTPKNDRAETFKSVVELDKLAFWSVLNSRNTINKEVEYEKFITECSIEAEDQFKSFEFRLEEIEDDENEEINRLKSQDINFVFISMKAIYDLAIKHDLIAFNDSPKKALLKSIDSHIKDFSGSTKSVVFYEFKDADELKKAIERGHWDSYIAVRRKTIN